ncbi:MAG: hypothetical protein HON65_02225 [Rhodospirillales bacterium]|nr:hypothetical protein [Rhodospirillales bacterium]
MAKTPEDTKDEEGTSEEPFENAPTELDELTHAELLSMYERSSEAILFSKNIQWRSVGSTLLVYAALTGIAYFGSEDKFLVNLLGALSIFLACGVIFVLAMYQFWQFNEAQRIIEIEKNFSSLYLKIRDIKSQREGNFHRYTILLFMCITVMLGAFVTNLIVKSML